MDVNLCDYWEYWFTLAEKMSITAQQPITWLASIEKGGIKCI